MIGLSASGSRYDSVEGSSELGNELLSSIKIMEFLD